MPKRREQLTAMLPLACMCGCGRAITKETPRKEWHVGHRLDAARGGRPTVENTGAIMRGCNLSSGGKLGAQISNARRNGKRQASTGIRTGEDAW